MNNCGDNLLPPHGGYEHLKTFQLAELIYDVTVRFCKRYVDRKSRTYDQMVQAARSGKQNIAEGSIDSGTSKKSELKLTNIARGSLKELALDYGDFLRERGWPEWQRSDPRREELIVRRPATVEDVARWARDIRGGYAGHRGRGGQSGSTKSTYAEIAANGALALIAVATELLRRQIARLERDFLEHGGFTERLYRARTRRSASSPATVH